jgi:N-methylhydantoinase A/oxoprolinase/acetone carboxylase beta subunit
MPRYRLGFDIGGTFTDFALFDLESGILHVHKRLTTPADPAAGALEGMQALLARTGMKAEALDLIVHGTTLVANTLIERSGAKVALLATRGFRDVLEIRNEQRYDIFDLFLQYPEPLVPRHLRLGVRERCDRDGHILAQPDDAELSDLAARLRAEGVEAVAVSFLHAYRNAQNERAVAQVITRALPDVPLSLSSEVAPEIREYERTSTTVANAYVQPRSQRYLSELDARLRETGYRGRLFLMLSSGGVTSAATAAAFPIRLIESGPAAGAMAAAHFGGLAGKSDVLSFDMGGTTAKLCLISGGQPSLSRGLEAARLQRYKPGSGIPLQFPSVDMIEIGAGGGSIASIDRLGLLKVGPASAGADPGPACYGLGGSAPTVTDANLVLGYLNPSYFLGGHMRLDTDAARRALATVAQPLGLSEVEAAWGIHQLVNESMAAAAKMHVVEKAADPRRFSLLAYGGGGPLHGAGVARILSAPEVICPLAAGVTSAIGLLIAPLSYELAQSYPVRWDGADLSQIEAILGEMERKGKEFLALGGVLDAVQVERSADGRFAGQLHEVTVPVPAGPLSARDAATVQDAFLRRYQERYGHLPPRAALEFLSWRVKVSGPRPPLPNLGLVAELRDEQADTRTRRLAYFGPALGFVETPVDRRYALVAGVQLSGPAIIEERESTAIIPPGMAARVDEQLTLIIRTNV